MRTANKVSQEIIDSVTDILDLSSEDIREDYSGRAMYGAICFGVVVPANKIPMVGMAFADAAARWISDDDEREMALDEVHTMMERARVDNMGLDMIVYFPGYIIGS